jgi:hypothetical protein
MEWVVDTGSSRYVAISSWAARAGRAGGFATKGGQDFKRSQAGFGPRGVPAESRGERVWAHGLGVDDVGSKAGYGLTHEPPDVSAHSMPYMYICARGAEEQRGWRRVRGVCRPPSLRSTRALLGHGQCRQKRSEFRAASQCWRAGPSRESPEARAQRPSARRSAAQREALVSRVLHHSRCCLHPVPAVKGSYLSPCQPNLPSGQCFLPPCG